MSQRSKKYSLELSIHQLGYLRELVQDDLDHTELSGLEQQHARSIIQRLEKLQMKADLRKPCQGFNTDICATQNCIDASCVKPTKERIK